MNQTQKKHTNTNIYRQENRPDRQTTTNTITITTVSTSTSTTIVLCVICLCVFFAVLY